MVKNLTISKLCSEPVNAILPIYQYSRIFFVKVWKNSTLLKTQENRGFKDMRTSHVLSN